MQNIFADNLLNPFLGDIFADNLLNPICFAQVSANRYFLPSRQLTCAVAILANLFEVACQSDDLRLEALLSRGMSETAVFSRFQHLPHLPVKS